MWSEECVNSVMGIFFHIMCIKSSHCTLKIDYNFIYKLYVNKADKNMWVVDEASGLLLFIINLE